MSTHVIEPEENKITKKGLFGTRVVQRKTNHTEGVLEFPLSLPRPPKNKNIHNLPKTPSHQISHHQYADPGIDPIGSPHPQIQYNGPLQKDSLPEPGSDLALTSSRTHISNPLTSHGNDRDVTHPESDMNKTNKNNIPQNKRNRDV
jgi:hypothetical protein